jgi:hypothetical protein
MEIPALSIDLLVEKNEDGLWGRVLDSPIGTAAALFHMPFAQKEVESFTRLISAPYRPDAGRLDSMRSAAKELGSLLFESLFSGGVGHALHRSMNIAYEQRARLRIRLRTSDDPELHRLPWEFLYNPERDEFVALSGHTPFSRYVDLMHQIRPLPAERPLRMLVVIASPDGYPTINVEREWLSLLDTIDVLAADGSMVVERMTRPTLFELQRRFRQRVYHLIHFVCHATFDPLAQQGFIVLEDEQQRGRLVSASHLATTLSDHFSLRLAVFHSASTWQIMPQEPLTNIAYRLVQRGLPATVVSPFEMTDRATLALAFDFYSRIAAGDAVDVALADARRAMLADISGVEWGGPILIMRAADGRIFEPTVQKNDGKAKRQPSRRGAATPVAQP